MGGKRSLKTYVGKEKKERKGLKKKSKGRKGENMDEWMGHINILSGIAWACFDLGFHGARLQ